jgi:hypothetical protein
MYSTTYITNNETQFLKQNFLKIVEVADDVKYEKKKQ